MQAWTIHKEVYGYSLIAIRQKISEFLRPADGVRLHHFILYMPKIFKNFQRPGLAQICHCHSRRVPICGSPCKQRFQLSGSVNACRDSPGAGGWNKSMNPWTPNVQSAVCKVCSCGLLLSCKKHRSKQLYSDSQFTLNSIDKQWHA